MGHNARLREVWQSVSRGWNIRPSRLPIVRVLACGAALWLLLAATAMAYSVGRHNASPAHDATSAERRAPIIDNLTVLTPGTIERYGRFEISFDVDTVATNLYFPYDASAPAGVESGVGVSVDALFLAPGEADWASAHVLPCFYYQPVERVGTGSSAALLPLGEAEWRCRFAPQEVGTWSYKITVTDAGGITSSSEYAFDCAECTGDRCRGFIRVSPTDPRFFEFSNGEPFVTPLVNVEQGNPFNSLAEIETHIADLGNNGVRFVRWFPTGEGANYFVAPFGDDISINWAFGAAYTVFDDVDTEAGKIASFRPYYYSVQRIPAQPGLYRYTLRAKVTGEQVLRIQVGNSFVDICSVTGAYHEAHGGVCDYRRDGWHDYAFEVDSTGSDTLVAGARGLYVSTDAPAPYNAVRNGSIRLHSMRLQRFEDARAEWGANLLTRGDPDTHTYVDQRSAARLDELLRLSEQYGVYHKLTLFEKNDIILNRIQPDGTIGDFYECTWGHCPVNFYSADGQAARWYEDAYVRYFVARWAYSPALHSLELDNESGWFEDPRDPGGGRILSFDAGWHVAELVKQLAPRPVLMTNSFWGYFINDFFDDPEHGDLIDYGDQHWYTSANETNEQYISNIWEDSAAYVRQCASRFWEYGDRQNVTKPIVRGEGGVASQDTQPQHPDVALDPSGTWYHKKLWAHVGILGSTCDGEWYPRLFVPYEEGRFPNNQTDLQRMFAAYERFVRGEPLSSGLYEEIGTDLSGDQGVLLSGSTGNLRAWGSRDSADGRVLLWVDNVQHTWKNVVDGAPISPASATLTVQGLPQGVYTAEWWNTHNGTVLRTASYGVGGDEMLSVTVEDLATDIAVKFRRMKPEELFNKSVAPRFGNTGDMVSFTLNMVGTGDSLLLTDTLPAAFGAPTSFEIAGTAAEPAYDSDKHQVTWTDVAARGQAVTIRFAVPISTTERQTVTNQAHLHLVGYGHRTASTFLIANPYPLFLPLIYKYR
jgi:hypothetical protein